MFHYQKLVMNSWASSEVLELDGTWLFQFSSIKTTSDAGTSDLDADKVIKLDTSVDMELQHCINIAFQCMSINAYGILYRIPGPPPRPII